MSCQYINSHYLPIADTGDCTKGVTVTVIGSMDVPSVILTTTSINLDDSEPLNCPDVNSTVDAAHYINFIMIVTMTILTKKVS